MLITRLLFWLHRLDELDYQVKYWRYFINEPLPEKKWRQFGRRLSNRSRRRVKATTFIVADVPVFMLNWLVPDSRIVGLDIDEKGLRLPKARTLSAKIAFLQPESLVVSPRFFKTFVHHTSFENKTRIYANQHFFTSLCCNIAIIHLSIRIFRWRQRLVTWVQDTAIFHPSNTFWL